MKKKKQFEINIAIPIQTFLGVERIHTHYHILVSRIFGHISKLNNITIPLSCSKNIRGYGHGSI